MPPPCENQPPALPQVRCPTCGRRVPWRTDNPWRPFCSERCRLIDLGEWFGENRRIPESDDGSGA